MNERLRLLAQQATDIVEIVNPDTGITHEREFFDQEKFAKSIVRECARVYWNIDDGELHDQYVEALKKHFGVER